MLFLDLLDSARSAYGGEENIEWWRPKADGREKAMALAEAAVMSRILLGYPIWASNPQLNDSVSLLRLAPKLLMLRDIKAPPLVAVFFDGENDIPASPESLIRMTVKYFEKELFKTSAWFPIEKPQALQIAKKIRMSVNDRTVFSRMLEGITLDEKYKDLLNEQAKNLQYLYQYLKDWQAISPACETVLRVKKKSTPNISKPISVWGNLERLRDHDSGFGISGDILDRMKEGIREIAKNKNKDIFEVGEDRSNLYEVLGKASENQFEREWIQRYIDKAYNQKVASSVSNGIGLFTMADVTEPIEPSMIENQSYISDEVPDRLTSDSAVGIEVLSLSPKMDTPNITWEHIQTIMQDPNYQQDIDQMQDMRTALYNAVKNKLSQSTIYEEQSRTYDAIEKLKISLSGKLGIILASENQEKGAVQLPFKLMNYLPAVTAGVVVAGVDQIPGLPFEAKIVATVADILITDWMKGKVTKKIRTDLEAAATGRVYGWLDHWYRNPGAEKTGDEDGSMG